VFVTGEYNWGVQPGLKNFTDHFLEESAEGEPVGESGQALEGRVPTLCRRSHVVGGSGKGAATAQTAAVLIAKQQANAAEIAAAKQGGRP
jgi:NAD(P)H-dependent FMN reductase